MKIGNALKVMLFGMTSIVVSGCGRDNDKSTRAFDGAEVRYRITVEVDTPDGTKRGSSVWSRSIRKSIGPISPYNASFSGEAVAVDLPDGNTMFALVSGQEGMVDSYFPELKVIGQNGGNDRVAHVRAIGKAVGMTKTVPCTRGAWAAWPHKTGNGNERSERYCPMLVRFENINDPTTVVRVDPNNLAASYGDGYRLSAIKVEITTAPLTLGIRERLNWLEAVGRERPSLIPLRKCDSDPIKSARQCYPNGLADIERISPMDFSSELYK